MPLSRKTLLGLLTLVLVGSCVGGEGPTDVGESALVRIALQPALIPSPADASALPIQRIRTVVASDPGGVVLREGVFDVSPTATSWTIDVLAPASQQPTDVVIYLSLINVAGDGTESVQFSGRTLPFSVTAGTTLTDIDVDIVRGPLSNLSVTGVAITLAPTSLAVGATAALSATVTTSGSATPDLFWTSLDPSVLTLADSVATGVSVGTAEVVASAGAFADTVSIDVYVPAVDSVRVSPDSADVQAGQTRPYTVQLFDAQGVLLTGRPVTWTTGSGAIATVSASGIVTGVAAGTTTVRATSEGVFDDAIVRVTAAPTGGGATITWTRNNNGNWSDPTSWNLGRVPQAGDTVRIEQGNGYVVTLDVNATIARLVIAGTSGVNYLDVGDRTLTITGTGAGDELDIRPVGAIEIDNGTVRVADVRNDGAIYAFGTPSTLEAATIVNTGQIDAVSDALLMISHATATDFQTSGTLTLESGGSLMLGPNTELTYQGGTIEETGVLFFQPGSRMILENDLSIDGPIIVLTGASISANDTENVTIGPTSALQLLAPTDSAVVRANLNVQGTLISAGPNALVRGLFVDVGGNVLVDGSDGDGHLATGDVENSGQIVLSGLQTRFGPGSAASPAIQNLASGTITLLPGATGFYLDGNLINNGTITVASPTTLVRETPAGTPVTAQHTNGGTLDIIAGGAFSVELGGASPTFTNAGTIRVGGGTTLSVTNLASPAGAIIATPTAILEGTGTVDVRAGVPTGVNNGVISPGLSPGALTWMGSVPMGPFGSIAIELEGTTPGTGYDQLHTSFQLFLNGNGTLNVTAPGFTPANGDRFAVLTYAQRVGNFGTVNLPSISGITFDTLWAEAGTVDTLYLVASAAPAAAVNRWVNAVSGNWSAAANWSTGAVPLPTDSVVIDVPGTYTVTIDVNAVARNLMLGGVSGVQTLNRTSGSLTLGGASLIGPNGLFTFAGADVNGTGPLVNQGTINLTSADVVAALSNQGILNISGSTVMDGALTTSVGSTLRIGGVSGTASVSIASSFTNNGLLELTTVSAANSSLFVTGTLTNAAGATITSLPGAGGVRTLGATLNNLGTVNVTVGLTLARASAAHVNGGTINVTGANLTVTQTGTSPSFTNNGTVNIATGRTMLVSGGALDVDQGTVLGPGTLELTGAVVLSLATSAVRAPMVMASAVTIPANVTVPATDTLTLLTGTTIDEPINNLGLIRVGGTVTFNGALTTNVGSTLRVGGATGNTAFAVDSSFTNNGLLELTTVSVTNTSMTVAGTLTNAAGATLTALPSIAGVRTLVGALNNLGTVNVTVAVTLAGASAVHTNAVGGTINVTGADLTVTQTGTSPSFTNDGTVNIATGRTMLVSGGALDVDQGTVLGPGTLELTGAVVLSLATSAVRAPMVMASAVTIPANVTVPATDTLTLLTGTTIDEPINNLGLIRVGGTVTFNGALTTNVGSTLRVGGATGNTAFAVDSSFTNNGLLELTTVSVTNTSMTVAGTLTNAAGATLTALPSIAGVRTLVGALNNLGTVNVTVAVTLAGASAVHTNAVGGTINVTGADLTVTQSGTTPSFTNNGTVNIATGRTMLVSGGALDVDQGTVLGPGTLELTGAVVLSLATSAVRAPMVMASAVTIPANVTIPATDTLTLLTGTTIDEPINNLGLIRVGGTVTFNGALTTNVGSTLRVGGATGNTAFAVDSSFTNNGLLELTTVSVTNTSMTVAGTLTNAAGATLTALPSIAGVRTLVGALNNLGTVNVTVAVTLAGASAVHTNAVGGTINVTGADLTVTQSGTTPSFTNDGTVNIATGRTMLVSGGALDVDQGTVLGPGTLELTGAVVLSLATSAVRAPMVMASAVTIPANVTIPATDTLTLLTGTTIDEPINNLGLIRVGGTVTFNGALTTNVGSTLRVGGATGNTAFAVDSSFTNNGLLELTTVSVTNTSMTVAGTLTNAAGATLTALPSIAGVRTLVGALNNLGTVNVTVAVTLAGASAVHTNAVGGTINVTGADLTVTQTGTSPSFTNDGTVNIATGRTMLVSGGALDVDQGTVLGPGTLELTGAVVLSLATSAVRAPMVMASAVTIPANVTVPATDTLTLLTGTTIDEPINNLGLIRVGGTVTFNGALTTNVGSTLRVGGATGNTAFAVDSSFTNNGLLELTTVSVTNTSMTVAGTLTNAAGATLTALPSIAGVRTLVGALNNLGTVNVTVAVTLAGASAVHTNAVGGTINVTGADLTVTQSGTTPSFTNNGTVNIATGRTMLVSGGALDVDQGTVLGPGTLELTGAVVLSLATSAVRAPMVMASAVTIPANVTIPATDTLTLLTGTTIDEPINNLGLIRVGGTVTFNGALTTNVGSTLRVGGATGNTAFAVDSSFTNNGLLELTTVSVTNTSMTVAGTLTNAAGATLTALPSIAGVRTLVGALSNSGTVSLNVGTTISSALDQLSGGALTLAVGQTLTVNGLMQLFAGSTTTALSGATVVKNGTCSPLGGAFSGFTCP